MALHLLSHIEQVAAHARGEILSGRWPHELPGVAALSKEWGVNHVTINAALQLLEQQGLLVSQGARRPRRVRAAVPRAPRRSLRIRILPYDASSRLLPHNMELLDRLHQAGFEAHFARRSMHEMGMDLPRIARFVGEIQADAWVVEAGSREVLEWFSTQPVPCIALFGRFSGLPIAAASPRAANAFIVAIRRLLELGHRRIVMLAREERRKPTPALIEQLFLDELEAHGVKTGAYHLPDWDDHAEGFLQCLDRLYEYTPPTALICGEPRLLVAAQQHLARRGILTPEHVSLLSSDTDATLGWCRPTIAHIAWDPQPVVRSIVRWARAIASGKDDRQQQLFEARFIEGGTLGRARVF